VLSENEGTGCSFSFQSIGCATRAVHVSTHGLSVECAWCLFFVLPLLYGYFPALALLDNIFLHMIH